MYTNSPDDVGWRFRTGRLLVCKYSENIFMDCRPRMMKITVTPFLPTATFPFYATVPNRLSTMLYTPPQLDILFLSILFYYIILLLCYNFYFFVIISWFTRLYGRLRLILSAPSHIIFIYYYLSSEWRVRKIERTDGGQGRLLCVTYDYGRIPPFSPV